MSMYLSNEDIGPTGWEASEFIDVPFHPEHLAVAAETDPVPAFLELLDDEQVSIAGDILQVSAHLWAVHGVIPVDGDVLLAEFATYDQARDALDDTLTQRARTGESDGGELRPGTRRCSLTDPLDESETS